MKQRSYYLKHWKIILNIGGVKNNIMWKVYLLEFILTLIVSIIWVRSIDKITTEHPDYKGEDFLDWDDNKVHTEDKL